MLKNIKVDLSVTNPILNLKDSIVDEISDSKIIRIKIDTKIVKSKNKSKSKNSIKPFSTKF